MNIRKLKIEHFGSISCFEAVFHSDLIVISGRNSEIIASAVKLLTGGRLSKQENFLFCSDTVRLSAEVELDREEIYYIEIKDSAQTGLPVFRALKPDAHEDHTEEYFMRVRQSGEEEISNIFSDFKNRRYPHKIKCYMDTEKYYPNGNFGDITDGIGTTKTFRSYLKNYIRTYKPQCLRKGKEYLLILDNNGEFRVTHPKLPVDTVPNLSESENILYHYLCFLNLSEFWYGIEQIKDIHYVPRPLIISAFVERIDSSIDITDFIVRTRKLGRQTFLMLPCGDVNRIGKIKDAQIVRI